MIHDILLSLLHPNPEMMDMYKIIADSDVSAPFLHPCEVQMLKNIVDVMENFRTIENFIKSVRSSAMVPETDDRSGLYMQAFASGLDESLDEYRRAVVDTEKRFLQNPHNPMTMVYVVIYPYNRLMEYLLRIIDGIKSQNVSGCSILQHLHRYQFDCVPENSKAVQIIHNAIQLVFFQQLSQWLIYGRLVDKYEEFFIVRQDASLSIADHHSKLTMASTTAGTTTTTTTMLSKDVGGSKFSQYELSYEHLPQFIDRSMADDILFIGQTVIKFNSHDLDANRDLFVDEHQLEFQMKASFWGDFEVKFFSYFGALFSKTEKLNLAKFRQTVVEMKKYVTEHLYKIAKKDSDLLHQLKLIKDFFLLGRGDQYEEFIKECRMLSGKNRLALQAKDLNKAFHIAAQSLNISDDLDQFSFCCASEAASNGPANESQNQSMLVDESLNHISMRYKVKWPLHMIFSAGVMERYNEIFRFMLRIKKAQHDLQLVWTLHREQKMDKCHLAVQFRNKLMFFIDNMFMYLQVDVVESRFSALVAAIQSCEDFLVIQKEHSLFQIMILSHCFLLNSSGGAGHNNTKADKFNENEVLMNLEKILSVVNVFAQSQLEEDEEHVFETQVPGMNTLKGLSDQFDSLIGDLMLRLMGLKSGPNGMPLTQLLLRLNFNYNFSKPQ